MSKFVVGSVPIDYNDEYYYPAGDQCDVGMMPFAITDSKEKAKAIVRDKLRDSCGRWWTQLAYDGNYDARLNWYDTVQNAIEGRRCTYCDTTSPEEAVHCMKCGKTDRFTTRGSYHDYPPEDFDVDAFKQWIDDNDHDIIDYYPLTWTYVEVKEV